jgi:hypothetical protein
MASQSKTADRKKAGITPLSENGRWRTALWIRKPARSCLHTSAQIREEIRRRNEKYRECDFPSYQFAERTRN